MSEPLFQDFPHIDKAQWLSQIEKDLKGKPFDELRWHLGEDLSFEPFYHSEDVSSRKNPFPSQKNWSICESIEVENEDYKTANKTALEALMGGADAIDFIIGNNISAAEMEILLENIELSYISMHFFYTGKKNRLAQKKLEHFFNIAKKRGENTPVLKGSLHIAPLGHAPNWENTAALVKWTKEHLPSFRAITVNGRSFHTTPEFVVDELAKTLHLANDFLSNLSEKGLTLAEVHQTLQFEISIDKSYFINIAKIRALKLLYLNIMKAYGLENEHLPPVLAYFDSLSFDENQNTNMIRATTMALSAVMGGADSLNVLPADPQNSSFSRKIARNVQHLLKMESYMDKVSDPAAGSYYIEQLTEILATKTWAKFQELSKK
jgi:methylmalonyl-CoA mutase